MDCVKMCYHRKSSFFTQAFFLPNSDNWPKWATFSNLQTTLTVTKESLNEI